MTKGERLAIIAKLTSWVPGAPELVDAARQNFELLSDDELVKLNDKVLRVRAHSRHVRASMSDISSNDSEEVARRSQLYQRLRTLKKKRTEDILAPRTEVGISLNRSIAPIKGEIAPKRLNPYFDDLTASLSNSDEFASSVRFWNIYESKRDNVLIRRLAEVIVKWLVSFQRVTFDRQLQRSFARSLFESPVLKAELGAYCELAVDRIGRDALRIVRNHLAHRTAFKPDADLDRGMVDWLLADKALSSTSFDLAFFSNPKGILPNAQAMEGLAKMRVFAQDYEADAIVSMAGGGNMVGDFLAQTSGLPDKPRWVLSRWRDNVKIAEGNERELLAAKRILLVDDVVSNRDDLVRAYTKLFELNEHASIQILALVGTMEGRGVLISEHKSAFIPNVTTDEAVDLPWARDGVYERRSGKHTFGQGTKRAWSVRTKDLDQLEKDLNASN